MWKMLAAQLCSWICKNVGPRNRLLYTSHKKIGILGNERFPFILKSYIPTRLQSYPFAEIFLCTFLRIEI